MAKKRPLPKVQAIVLCDHLYRDGTTGKTIICGTFTRINAPAFPTAHAESWLYLNLVDFTQTSIVVQLVRLDKNEVLWITDPLNIKSVSKLAPHEVSMRLPRMEFREPGGYAIEVLRSRDKSELAMWRFDVRAQGSTP